MVNGGKYAIYMDPMGNGSVLWSSFAAQLHRPLHSLGDQVWLMHTVDYKEKSIARYTPCKHILICFSMSSIMFVTVILILEIAFTSTSGGQVQKNKATRVIARGWAWTHFSEIALNSTYRPIGSVKCQVVWNVFDTSCNTGSKDTASPWNPHGIQWLLVKHFWPFRAEANPLLSGWVAVCGTHL